MVPYHVTWAFCAMAMNRFFTYCSYHCTRNMYGEVQWPNNDQGRLKLHGKSAAQKVKWINLLFSSNVIQYILFSSYLDLALSCYAFFWCGASGSMWHWPWFGRLTRWCARNTGGARWGSWMLWLRVFNTANISPFSTLSHLCYLSFKPCYSHILIFDDISYIRQLFIGKHL